MRNLSVFTAVFCSMLFAQWPQQEFAISVYFDPELTGIPAADEQAYRNARNANFNTILGHYGRGFGGATWTIFAPGNVSIPYRLARIAAVGGLSMHAVDWDIHSGNPNPNVNSVLTHYTTGLPNGLPPASRSVHAGYMWADEPDRPTMNNRELPILTQLANGDPSRIAWFPLGAIWRTGFNWADYTGYVDDCINTPNVKVISFDYYPFNSSVAINRMAINGFTAFENPLAVSYHRHLELIANRVRTARNNGRVVNFWGFGNSTDHEPDGIGGARHHPAPTLAMLRYEAYSVLAYGGKGMNWFTYELPDIVGYHSSPIRTLDPTLLPNITQLNLHMRNVGPTLMRLRWIATVHGTATDPNSTEPGLQTLASIGGGQDVLFQNQTFSGLFKVGILRDDGSGENYLLVHNKDVTANRAITLTVNGLVRPARHVKSGDSWERIAITKDLPNSRTTLSLNVAPGNGELIRLGRCLYPFIVPTILRRR